MRVVPYSSDMAEAVTTHYNEQTTGVPFCFTVTAQEMDDALHTRPPYETRKTLADPSILVVTEGDKVLGLTRAGWEPADDERRKPRPPSDSSSTSEATARPVRLCSTQHMSHSGRPAQTASGPFHQDQQFAIYHAKYSFCSDGLDHVQALLQMNGYRKCDGEVYPVWRNAVAPELRPIRDGVTFELEWVDGRSELPGLNMRAMLDGEEIGRCMHCCLGDHTRWPEADVTAFCHRLDVYDNIRAAASVSTCCTEPSGSFLKRGYVHMAISTAWDNYRAFLFYSNCGYRAVDWTYGFRLTRSEA